MSVLSAHHRYTYDEYLRFERQAGVRCEFHDGEIYAMAGGSIEHSALGARTVALLTRLAKEGCIAHGSDQKVFIPAEGLTTYADALLVCGRAERRNPEDNHALSNPRVVVEVLSPSSEKYDRQEKRELYMSLPSLESYIVVAQDERRVQVWTRTDASWTTRTFGPGTSLSVPSLVQSVDVDSIYDGILDPTGRSLL